MTTFQNAEDAQHDAHAELAIWQERARQLQHALDSRIVVEQAKGMLAERFGCDVETAFGVLRHAARSSHRNLRELAAEVVARPVTPPAVAEAFRTRRLRRRG